MVRKNNFLSYDDIAFKLDSLAETIKKENFEAIVIVLRGASFPGMHMAFATSLPYHFIKYDRKNDIVSWLSEPAQGKKILLCEDFAGKGVTLVNCKRFLAEQGYDLKTLVICKDTLSASVPDYYCYDGKSPDERFILPWERHLLNQEGQDATPDIEFEKTGWDFDGIFIKDVEKHIYEENLEKALSMRDDLPMCENAPQLSEKDVIITGRPLEDEERTKVRLKVNGIRNRLYLRDDSTKSPTYHSTAKWKGAKAISLACTKYVESEAEQAVIIANLYPELKVFWWNDGNPMLIKSEKVQ